MDPSKDQPKVKAKDKRKDKTNQQNPIQHQHQQSVVPFSVPTSLPFLQPVQPSPVILSSLDEVVHIYYINLDRRTDRRAHMEQQWRQLGIPPGHVQRFPAIAMSNGAVGCTLSHIKVLERAIQNHLPYVLVCEDDMECTNVGLFRSQFQQCMQRRGPDWDVILLGGNNCPPFQPVDSTCVQVTRCQTTTAYLVRGAYIPLLMSNMKQGLALLLREPTRRTDYALDRYWFHLQRMDRWFLIVPLTIIQQEGYSDIEQRRVNYSSAMLDLDKARLFQRRK